jgi:hypothetical protein
MKAAVRKMPKTATTLPSASVALMFAGAEMMIDIFPVFALRHNGCRRVRESARWRWKFINASRSVVYHFSRALREKLANHLKRAALSHSLFQRNASAKILSFVKEI